MGGGGRTGRKEWEEEEGRRGEGGRRRRDGKGRGMHVLRCEDGCGEVGMGDDSETNQVGMLYCYTMCVVNQLQA